jgi:hypothetical protein
VLDEADEVDDEAEVVEGAVVVVVVVVEAEAEPVEDEAVDVVADAEVVELVSDVHSAEKPFASSYTFTSRPLVGTVSVQSGGLSEMMLSISDWQLSDAHMSVYSASVGRAVEYRRL